jgi:hypothetical protein
MNERQLIDEINRLAGEYMGEPCPLDGMAGKPLIWLHARATAFTMMVRLRQRSQESAAQFSNDEHLAYSIAGTPPDDLLRAWALSASAQEIWMSGAIPVEAEAFDHMLDELIARTFTEYRGHRISYRKGQYYVDSFANHSVSLIGAMQRIDRFKTE